MDVERVPASQRPELYRHNLLTMLRVWDEADRLTREQLLAEERKRGIPRAFTRERGKGEKLR